MKVVRMRRGWRLRLTDNEYEMLKEVVNRGLVGFDGDELPYKVRKVLGSNRWSLPHGPLIPDEDRRSVA
jgi:hypothetical protein